MEFKRNYCTSEFQSSAIFLAGAVAAQFYVEDLRLWAYAVTAVCVSYIISRAFFKSARGVIVQSDKFQKTTEFYFFLAGIAILSFPTIQRKLSLEIFLLNVAILHVAYNLGRGHTKSLKGNTSRTTILR